ncbi:MAG: hypothetical protein IJY94_02780 [Clostridia bacterium]|nr:hypothetical protein [Clostridia bacterium]
MKKRVLSIFLACLMIVSTFIISKPHVDVRALENTAENLPDGIVKVADMYYFMGETIYENDFDGETVGSLPEGWSYGSDNGSGEHKTKYGWHESTKTHTVSAQVIDHADHGKVVELSATTIDLYVALPETGTMNYVYEATVVLNKVRNYTSDAGSFGCANNYYGTTYDSKGVMFAKAYTNSVTHARWCYRGTSTTNTNWNTNYKPAVGDEIKFKIVSFEGNNYVYYNGNNVAVVPWRTGAGSSDNTGFYVYNTNVLVKNVKVTAIEPAATFSFDAARIKVDEYKNVYLNADLSFDKDHASYKEYVNGDYVADGAEDFVLGYVSYVGDEDITDTLTAETENAVVNVIPDSAITQDKDMIYANVSVNIPAESKQSLVNIRPFIRAHGLYFYSDGYAYTPARLANGAHESASTKAEKDIIAEFFGDCGEFVVGSGAKKITFTAFADLHYYKGTYSTTVNDLNAILKSADDTGSAFVLSAGDMCNDFNNSPELVKAFHGYITAEGKQLNVYNVYGNHELEASGNTMQGVTPTLTNDANVHWGDGTVGSVPSDLNIGYYYVDVDGFRIVCVDNNYNYNPNHYKNPDGSMGEVVGWEHYAPGHPGTSTAAVNAKRGFCEGADAVACTKGGSLGDVQLVWLEEILLEAAGKDLTCIVIGHEAYSGLGFVGDAKDAAEVRAIYKKANDANPGTVMMSINGHWHTNHQGWNDGVFYLDLNTVRNTLWMGTGVPGHYGSEHTYLYQNYDADGNPVGDPVKTSLNSLKGSANTWFSEDPVFATITLNSAGIITIDGVESDWAYGVTPPNLSSLKEGVEPKITSGTFWDCDLFGHIEGCVPNDEATHRVGCTVYGCDYTTGNVPHNYVDGTCECGRVCIHEYEIADGKSRCIFCGYCLDGVYLKHVSDLYTDKTVDGQFFIGALNFGDKTVWPVEAAPRGTWHDDWPGNWVAGKNSYVTQLSEWNCPDKKYDPRIRFDMYFDADFGGLVGFTAPADGVFDASALFRKVGAGTPRITVMKNDGTVLETFDISGSGAEILIEIDGIALSKNEQLLIVMENGNYVVGGNAQKNVGFISFEVAALYKGDPAVTECDHAEANKATCKDMSVCPTCGRVISSVDPDNHVGTGNYVSDGNGNHKFDYDCCDARDSEMAKCEYADGECKYCGAACKHADMAIDGTSGKVTCQACGYSKNGTYVKHVSDLTIYKPRNGQFFIAGMTLDGNHTIIPVEDQPKITWTTSDGYVYRGNFLVGINTNISCNTEATEDTTIKFDMVPRTSYASVVGFTAPGDGIFNVKAELCKVWSGTVKVALLRGDGTELWSKELTGDRSTVVVDVKNIELNANEQLFVAVTIVSGNTHAGLRYFDVEAVYDECPHNYGNDNICDYCGHDRTIEVETEDVKNAIDNILNGGTADVTVVGPTTTMNEAFVVE